MINLENVNLYYELFDYSQMQIRKKFINYISKEKSKEKFIHAIKDMNLKLNAGEITGIVGKNGSGKSSLLKVLAGIIRPNTGSVNTNAKRQSLIDYGIGMMDAATGIENIFLALYTKGFFKNEILKKIDWIIQFSELKDSIHRPIRTYSTGMRIRLGISIILSQDFDILLVDEFFGHGDVQFVQKVRNFVIDKITKKNGSIAIATHDESIINSFCNRKITLNNGIIISDEKL